MTDQADDLGMEALQADRAAAAAQQAQPQPQPPPALPTRAAAPRLPPPPAPPQNAPGAQPIDVSWDNAPAEKPKQGALKDFGDQMWASTLQMGEGLLGATSLAARKLTENPDIVQHIENGKAFLADHVAKTVEGLSPEAQNAMHASIFGGQDANGEKIPTPGEVGYGHYIGSTLASAIPAPVFAILGGSLIAAAAPEMLAAAAATAGTAGIFGAQQAGDAYNALVEQVDKAKDADMRASSPVYDHLRESGASEVTAKRTIVGQISGPLAAKQFAVGAVAGAGAGRLLTEGALGAAGRGFATRAAVGAGEGAVTMGAQAGVGDTIQQNAQIQAGTQKEFDPNEMAHAYVSGALGGALLGAGGAAVHGGHAPEATKEPGTVTSIAGTAEHAALTEALQLDLPLDKVGPGINPGSPQGELFRSASDANPAKSDPMADQAAQTPPSGGPAPAASPTPGQGELLPAANAPGANTREVNATTPEPSGDVAAQMAALADPNNPKDAVFIAKGTPMPANVPQGVKVMVRKAGTLLTNNPDKAKLYMAKGDVDEARMAQILGYPETKDQVAQSGAAPTVVQGRDAEGNVVHESAASPEGVPAAQEAAAATVPDGTVQTLTPEEAQARRADLSEEPPHPVDVAAAKAEEPTPAQSEAGNYTKGHLNLHGLDVSIETPRGGTRRGPVDPETGKPAWEATMPGHYGYIRGTKGADGDHLDVTMGPRTGAIFDGKAADAAHEPVFVVDQIDPATGKFDEHKALVGFHTQAEAERAYDASFSDNSGPKRRGAVNEMTFDKFKDWTQGDTTKPISYKTPDKGELLRRKRAAEKAKLNPVKVEKKAAAYVAEGEARDTTTDLENRNDALRKLQEGLARSSVIQVKKGADIAPIMAKVIRELSERIGRTDGSPDAVAEQVAEWTKKAPSGPIPGTTTGYRDVGNHVMQLLTGRKLESRIKDTARETAQPAIYESEGRARAADIEDKLAETTDKFSADEAGSQVEAPSSTVVEESSAGMTQDYGAEKQRSEQTTNKERILSDLESKVANGLLSPAEADREYGRKEKGTGGRDRKYPDLASYLKERLKEAENPENEKKLIDAARKIAEDKTLTNKDRERLTKEIKASLDQTNPDYADKLRGMIEELEDPVGKEARAQEGRNAALDKLAAARDNLKSFSRKPTPEAIAYRKLLADPRVTSVVKSLLGKVTPDGRGPRLGEYLNAIASDATIQNELPMAAALARRLRSQTDPSMPVMTHDIAAHKYGSTAFARGEDAGTFFPEHQGREAFIALHPDDHSSVETLLHETMHSVTSHYIDKLADNHPDAQVLDAIRDELRDARDASAGNLTDRQEYELNYALQDRHELHTMLMTNPTVQAFAAAHVPSSKFRIAMNDLGHPPQESRSVWQAFTGFVRRALGMDSRADSFLDHIMRPLQDITDRAAAKGKADPGSLPDVASYSLKLRPKDMLGDVAGKIDIGGKGDTARKALLSAATTDGIVKWNSDLFESRDKAAPGNSLRDYRSATEAVAATTAKFHDQYADRVKNLISSIKGAERDKLATLMVDATTAEAKLGRSLAADANDHLKDADQQATLKALQARYDALSTKGQETYDASRKYFQETYQAERDAQIRSMVRTALPDATPEQVKAVAEAARTKKGINELIAESDHNDVAAAFGTAWNSNRAIVKGIAKAHSMGVVQGDYFPLRRHGDYVVRYGEKGSDNYGVEMFEKLGEAEDRRAELLKQGQEGVSQVLNKRTNELRTIMPTTVVDDVAASLERNGATSEHVQQVRDAMASVLLQHATRSEAARARLRRQGVKGASTDVERVIAQDFLSTASRMGYLEAGPERMQALSAMQRHADWLGRNGEAGEQRRAQQVLNEVQLRQPSGDDASGILTGAARKMGTLGFVQSLMSPSHMLTSSIEAHMNSTALLSARHGLRAGLALTKALRDVTPVMAKAGARNTLISLGKGMKAADWNLANVVRDRLIAQGANKANMTDLFKRLTDAGLIDHSMVREMQRIANPGSDITRGWWQKFLDFNSAGAHAVDVANKTAIAKAAYDLELRKTGNHDKAAEYALETARQSMPNYNLANKARIATDKGGLGAFAGPLMQFKQYGLHMYSVMANLVHTSVHGASKEERKEARMAFAGILATHAMMAGSLTLVGDPLRYIGGAYDWATGADKPHDYENDARRWMAAAFGPTVAELMARGLPHMAGIDIHRRVGLSNLLEVPELQSFDKKGFMEMLASAMTGASGQDAAVMAGGMTKMFHGDVAGGLKDLVPRVIRDPIKAQGLATKGVTDSKGKTILPADKLSGRDVAVQALGFQPSKVSEFREGRAAVQEAKAETGGERQKLIAGLISAAGDDRSDLLQSLREFNMKNPGQAITYSQLLQAQQRTRKAAQAVKQQPASFGLALKPKAASQLSKAGSFANVQ